MEARWGSAEQLGYPNAPGPVKLIVPSRQRFWATHM